MKSKINLRQVEAFRAVMLTGKMTAAAELLSITQPAVSRLISDLEHATKLQLFERRGNQIAPTGAATTLMGEVQRSFVGLNRIALIAEDIGRHAAGTLRIATMPALGNGLLPRFLAHFLRDRPRLNASLSALPSHMVVEAVATGQADIGYADEPLEPSGFRIEPHPIGALVAIPGGHPLAQKTVIEPSDLVHQRVITLDPGTLFAMRVEIALADVPRQALLETRLSQTALHLVNEQVGITLVDPASATEFIGRNIVFRPFSVFIDAGFQIIRPANDKNHSLTAHFADAFLTFYQAQIDQLLEQPDEDGQRAL